jgi:hypothetical protein
MVVYPDADDRHLRENGPILPGTRPPPPQDLTPRQREIWAEITASVDRDWFSENFLLLTELCAHTDYARTIAASIEVVRERLAGLPLGAKDEVALSRRLASLMRAHAKQTSSIATLSTRLRLTPQSRQSARAADQVRRRTAPARRPWEDWQDS